MTLRAKLLSLVLFVGIVPLLVYSLMALRTHEQALTRRLLSEQGRTAEHGAALLSQRLDAAEAGISLFAQKVVQWGELSPQEREGALWLLYRQSDDIAVALLLDETGAVLHTAQRSADDTSSDLASHPAAGPPLAAALLGAAKGRGVRGAYLVGEGGPFAPMTFPVDGRGRRWVVAAAVTVRDACADARRAAESGVEVLLVSGGTVLCGASPGAALHPDLIAAAAAGRREARHSSADGETIAALASVQGGTIVVRQPAARAFAASRTLRMQAALWISVGLAIALMTGWLISRDIRSGIDRLVTGAVELARGNVSHRIPESGRDELAHLARTFNQMSGEIEKRDSEIRGWNRELQTRVDQRTEDLRIAHQQLLQHQKLVAVASLGAGVAHEINGPLAGLLGLTQVLRARLAKSGDTSEAQLVSSIEKEAGRLREVVGDFVSVTQEFVGPGFVRVPLEEVVDAALASLASEIESAKIEVVRSYEATRPEVFASRVELQEMFVQVARNARIAMTGNSDRPRRLEVEIATAEAGQLVRATVRDNGRGIPPENLSRVFDPFFTTKQDWSGEGLGLTLAYRVAQGHHGTIRLESQPGVGTSAIITLPTAGRGAHLA